MDASPRGVFFGVIAVLNTDISKVFQGSLMKENKARIRFEVATPEV